MQKAVCSNITQIKGSYCARIKSDALLAQVQHTLAHLPHIETALHHCEYGIVTLVQNNVGKGWEGQDMQQCTDDPLE